MVEDAVAATVFMDGGVVVQAPAALDVTWEQDAEEEGYAEARHGEGGAGSDVDGEGRGPEDEGLKDAEQGAVPETLVGTC